MADNNRGEYGNQQRDHPRERDIGGDSNHGRAPNPSSTGTGLNAQVNIQTASGIEKLIQNEIYSPLGVDVFDLQEYAPEFLITELDIFQGLLEYYRFDPYTSTAVFEFLFKTATRIRYENWVPSTSGEWSLIGITAEGRKFNLTNNLLDYRLTGIPIANFYVDNQQYNYTSTSIDQNLGKPEYWVDYLDKEIIVIDGGDASLSVTLAWMSTNLQRIKPNHIKEVAKLISLSYYERILGFRGQIQLQDFNWSMDLHRVENKLNRNIIESKAFQLDIKRRIMLKG